MLFKRLIVKNGDVILKGEKGKALVPMPKLTKSIRENQSLLEDVNFLEKNFGNSEGKGFWLWKASKQRYIQLYFDNDNVLIEV